MNNDDFLFVEKYRPRTVEDCILPTRIKKTFQEFVDKKEIPNLILTGPAGVGKTSIAIAMCEEIDCNYMIINSSEERGIDTLRTKITGYASTVSLTGGHKVIILDEADGLTCFSGQQSLKVLLDGEIVNKTINECVDSHFTVPTVDITTGNISFADAMVIPKGTKDVYEVEFEDGSTMICTSDHIFFGENGEETTILESKILQSIDEVDG